MSLLALYLARTQFFPGGEPASADIPTIGWSQQITAEPPTELALRRLLGHLLGRSRLGGGAASSGVWWREWRTDMPLIFPSTHPRRNRFLQGNQPVFPITWPSSDSIDPPLGSWRWCNVLPYSGPSVGRGTVCLRQMTKLESPFSISQSVPVLGLPLSDSRFLSVEGRSHHQLGTVPPAAVIVGSSKVGVIRKGGKGLRSGGELGSNWEWRAIGRVEKIGEYWPNG
ncbi:uncharacterized protein CANTADRAFT_24978 [Suhomyces tanzawaensis NRRL Y-17324]|uniref:Uncharacterized protein n=1 Tax=Suhomyces tanzawaensis NRRL Y-17324 TaxID=984487 RepID=A0A1E4SSW2_9ASCO|nr:uncharacterized protein CANTADRAFT_24978 [Suhomyces tanzawaensis NRRL Y-17324]ODV82482.1 hypothetical protein CANTADRAFT_24978 [Suhomyces tanzawaensis NRRL Y-17324]